MRSAGLPVLISAAAILACGPAAPRTEGASPPPSPAAEVVMSESSVPVAGGVADPATGHAFVAAPAGQLVALDVSTGLASWKVAGGVRPLMVAGPTLLTAEAARGPRGRPGFRVVSRRATDGQVLRRSARIELPYPRWHVTGARLQAGATLWVGWRALDPRAIVGMIDGEPPAATGHVRIDLVHGAVSSAPVTAPAADTPARPPASPGRTAYPDTAGSRAPWSAAGYICAFALDSGPPPSLVLERWDVATGRAQAVVELVPSAPPAGYARLTRTGDGGHVAARVSNHEARPGQPPGSTCRGGVFSIREGRRVVSLPDCARMEDLVTVLAGRVLVAETAAEDGGPRHLLALDLHTGRPVWRAPLAPLAGTEPL